MTTIIFLVWCMFSACLSLGCIAGHCAAYKFGRIDIIRINHLAVLGILSFVPLLQLAVLYFVVFEEWKLDDILSEKLRLLLRPDSENETGRKIKADRK